MFTQRTTYLLSVFILGVGTKPRKQYFGNYILDILVKMNWLEMERVPKDLPFTLQNLYKSSALEDTNGRYPLGLQLRVEELKAVGAGLGGGGLHGCRTGAQSHWLCNGEAHSWQEVGQAVENSKVVRRSEDVHRRREAKTEREAIDQVEASLQELVTSERNFALEQRKLEEELRGRNESFRRKQGEWRREGDQWKQQSETRGEMLAAVRSGHCRELLREVKGLPEDESNPAVECYLRKKVVDEEVKRSKQLMSCHQQIDQHHRYLEHKLEEIRELKVVEECTHKKTADLVQILEKADMKPAEEVRELHEHLENLLEKLQQTLRSLESTLRDYDRALEESKDYLKECNCDISEMLESLTLSLQELEMSLRTVIECKLQVEEEIDEKLEILRSTLIGGVGVAAGGAALGQLLGPVGALVGAGIGALIGGTAGLASGISEYRKKERESDKYLETLEQEKSTYERVIQECQNTARCAKVLLETSADRNWSQCSNPP